MDDDEIGRLGRWQHTMTHAYVHIAKTLASLDLPIRVPMNFHEEDFIGNAMAEIGRIEGSVIDDVPMPDLARGLIRMAILDWLAAIEVGAVQVDDPEPDRERVFVHLIRRILGGCEMAQDLLDPDHPLNE